MTQLHSILLVNDDPGQLDAMRRALTDNGYQVMCEQTAYGALACDREWLADLLICTYELGGEEISGLVEAMHRQNPGLRFIILTPQGRTLEIMRSMRNRVAAFLSSPFNHEDLLYYVSSVLNAGESAANRREHSRYLFSVETHCVLINPFDNSEGRPIPALIRDVSRSGVSIIVRQLLPVPAMLKLVAHLNEQMPPVALLAKSVSCMLTQIHGVYRVGIKFIGLLPRELTSIVLQNGVYHEGTHGADDIYMGKTFCDAVREWLGSHQKEGLIQSGETLDVLAAEVSRAESEHYSQADEFELKSSSSGRPARPVDLFLANDKPANGRADAKAAPPSANDVTAGRPRAAVLRRAQSPDGSGNGDGGGEHIVGNAILLGRDGRTRATVLAATDNTAGLARDGEATLLLPGDPDATLLLPGDPDATLRLPGGFKDDHKAA